MRKATRVLSVLLLLAMLLGLLPTAYAQRDGSLRTTAEASSIPVEYQGVPTMHLLPPKVLDAEGAIEQNLSMVFMTNKGRVIVVDGGRKNADADYLFTYLQTITGKEKPHVDAWFFTHAHTDHVGCFHTIASKYADKLTVGTVYHHFPTDSEIATYFAKEDDPENLKKKVNDVLASATKLKNADGGAVTITKVNSYHSGKANSWINIDDISVEVVACMDEMIWGYKNVSGTFSGTLENNNATFNNWTMPDLISKDFNNSSTVYRFHLGGKTVLIMGDIAAGGGIILEKLHDKNASNPSTYFSLKSDIVQVSHHGRGKFPKSVYTKIAPKVALWPTTPQNYNGPSGSSSYAYYTRQWLKSCQTYLAYEGPYAFPFGTDSLLFDFNTDADAVSRYNNGSYGMLNFSNAKYWNKGPDMKTASISGGKMVLTTAATKTTKASSYIETTTAISTDKTHPLSYTPKSGDIVMIRYKVNSYDPTTNAKIFGEGITPTLNLYASDSGTETYDKTSQASVDTSGKYMVQKWTVPASWTGYNITNIHFKVRYFLNSSMSIDYIYVGPPQDDSLFFDFTDTREDLDRYGNIVYGDYNYDRSNHWATMNAPETTISDGTMKLAISDTAIATAIEPSDSATKFGYANKSNENAFVLNYSPAKAEVLQVRVKFTDVTGTSPEFFFDYYGDNDSAWASYMTGSNYELIRTSLDQACMDGGSKEGQFVLLTIPLTNSNFVKKSNINAIRFDIYGAQGGTAEIDYIYIGTADGAPSRSYTVNFTLPDGTLLESREVQEGTTAIYGGATPEMAADAENHYHFSGWSAALENVSSDMTVVAQFTPESHAYSYENADGENHSALCNCGYSKTEAHAWDEGVLTRQSSCEAEGIMTYTCGICKATKEESLAATGHSYSATVTAPTCTAGGYTTYACSACGDSYIADETAALGHSYEAVVTPPNCTDTGYTTYTCSLCGDSYVADETPVVGHSYASVVIEPTCTESGYAVYICNCGDTYLADYVAALGHNEQAVVTAPTCTEAGYTTYTCSVCGDSYVADETPATGHVNTTTTTTDATCTEEGSVVVTCACGEVVSTETVAALGHSYVYSNNGEDHSLTCGNNCGYTAKELHSYAEGVCVCGALEVVEPEVDESITIGEQLYLESDLTMNFRIKESQLTAYDLSTAYLVVERDIYATDGTMVVDKQTITEFERRDSRLVFVYSGIAASQMNDEIRVTLFLKDKGGKEFKSVEKLTSITTYTKTLLETMPTGYDKLYAVVMDMLNYGTAAQIYFNRHADAPANEAYAIFADYAAYATGEGTTLEDLSGQKPNDGAKAVISQTLDLGTRIGIQYKVTLPEGVKAEAAVLVVCDAEGKALESITLSTGTVDNRGRYVVNFYGLASRQMREAVTATLYADGAVISDSYTYSISSYAYAVANTGGMPENLIKLTKLMLTYGDSANAYFSK